MKSPWLVRQPRALHSRNSISDLCRLRASSMPEVPQLVCSRNELNVILRTSQRAGDFRNFTDGDIWEVCQRAGSFLCPSATVLFFTPCREKDKSNKTAEVQACPAPSRVQASGSRPESLFPLGLSHRPPSCSPPLHCSSQPTKATASRLPARSARPATRSTVASMNSASSSRPLPSGIKPSRSCIALRRTSNGSMMRLAFGCTSSLVTITSTSWTRATRRSMR
jgi:hypothetical protein